MTESFFGPIAIFISAANGEEGSRLAEMLITKRLAACVQILPEIQSIYRWQDKIERQVETLLIVKTESAKFEELQASVRGIHSYETPEIVAVPIVAGAKSYLDWLTASID